MSAASSKCNPTTSEATPSATSSPALADGATPCGLPDGPMTDLFGQALAHVSRSARPASSVAATMSATYGLRSSASSASVALQQSLASRLQERLDSRGSTMFVLTWKAQATPLRRQICRLAASAHRTGDSGCGGWPTTSVMDAAGSARHGYMNDGRERAAKNRRREVLTGNAGTTLTDAARMAWATPASRDYRHANSRSFQERSNSKKGEQLCNQVVHGLTLNSTRNFPFG